MMLLLLLLLEQYQIQQNSSTTPKNLNWLLQVWERGFDIYFMLQIWVVQATSLHGGILQLFQFKNRLCFFIVFFERERKEEREKY